MIKKNKRSTSYLNHPLNHSPSKTTIKFGNEPRFIQKKTFSPDKFYDLPDALEKRGTSFGYGNKVDFAQEQFGEPAKYQMRSQFDQISQRYRYGVRPLMRQLPKQLFKEKSPSNDIKRINSTTFSPSVTQNSPNIKKKTSPLTQSKQKKQEQSGILQSNQAMQNIELPKQKKSAYRLKYQYSNSYLLDNKKSSYIEFIREKKSPPNESMTTFRQQTRWKRDNSFKNVGPGSYNRFSQFGQNQNAY